MNLKEKMAFDLDNVFFNPDEFGEEHVVEGSKIMCMLDNSTLHEKQGGAEFAIGVVDAVLHARITDLPPRQTPGTGLLIDGTDYMVVSWEEEVGMAIIALSIGQA